MDMTDAIAAVSDGRTYTLRRRGPATLAAGMRVAGVAVLSPIRNASMQPVNGRDLARLPEGMRTTELRVFFSPLELKTAGKAQEPDVVIEPDGEEWEVQSVQAWVTLGAYWRAVVAKVKR